MKLGKYGSQSFGIDEILQYMEGEGKGRRERTEKVGPQGLTEITPLII